MNPQFIRTPNGDELVILPRADYEALVSAAAPYDEDAEDAEDVAIFDARMADAAGSERLPTEVSTAMLKGAGLLTALRKWRGLNQAQLAEKAGVGQGFLSELEGKKKGASAETMAALAKALDVPESWLAFA